MIGVEPYGLLRHISIKIYGSSNTFTCHSLVLLLIVTVIWKCLTKLANNVQVIIHHCRPGKPVPINLSDMLGYPYPLVSRLVNDTQHLGELRSVNVSSPDITQWVLVDLERFSAYKFYLSACTKVGCGPAISEEGGTATEARESQLGDEGTWGHMRAWCPLGWDRVMGMVGKKHVIQ